VSIWRRTSVRKRVVSTGDPGLIVPYQIRTVRVGVEATFLAVISLLIFYLAPGHGHLEVRFFLPLMVAAALGGSVVAAVPWRRLFDAGLGMWCLYAWSIADILLITFGVAVTGLGRSELFLLYGLTTLFFAAS
jgi:hypothetical protein